MHVKHPYLCVTGKGRWTLFKAHSTTADTIQSGVLTQSKLRKVQTGFGKLGEIDMRIGAAILALICPQPSWTLLANLVSASPQADAQTPCPKKPRHIHWLFAEHLRAAIGATQFVGSPPTACSFGFSQIVHNKATPPLALDTPSQAATVVWLNGMNKQSRIRALPLLNSSHPILVVASYKLRHSLQRLLGRPTKWKKVASFPAQSRLMLATNQYDFTPKASKQVLEVWANRPAACKRELST